VDPRLPGGGGYVVSGLYDVAPDKAGQVSNLIADSSKYGRWYQYFNGLDATLNLRAGGFTFTGGRARDRPWPTTARCGRICRSSRRPQQARARLARARQFHVSPVSPYCHVAFGIQTQFRGLASYELPGIGAQLSATLQSKPGAMLAANYSYPNGLYYNTHCLNIHFTLPTYTYTHDF
jgi:hypothetical protein